MRVGGALAGNATIFTHGGGTYHHNNGTEDLSHVVPVLFSGGALTLFPNPTDGTTLWLSIDAADAEPMHMEIMDGLGRTVRSETIALSAGRQVVYLLGGGTLAAGTYTARLFRGGTPIALPVVVQ